MVVFLNWWRENHLFYSQWKILCALERGHNRYNGTNLCVKEPQTCANYTKWDRVSAKVHYKKKQNIPENREFVWIKKSKQVFDAACAFFSPQSGHQKLLAGAAVSQKYISWPYVKSLNIHNIASFVKRTISCFQENRRGSLSKGRRARFSGFTHIWWTDRLHAHYRSRVTGPSAVSGLQNNNEVCNKQCLDRYNITCYFHPPHTHFNELTAPFILWLVRFPYHPIVQKRSVRSITVTPSLPLNFASFSQLWPSEIENVFEECSCPPLWFYPQKKGQPGGWGLTLTSTSGRGASLR